MNVYQRYEQREHSENNFYAPVQRKPHQISRPVEARTNPISRPCVALDSREFTLQILMTEEARDHIVIRFEAGPGRDLIRERDRVDRQLHFHRGKRVGSGRKARAGYFVKGFVKDQGAEISGRRGIVADKREDRQVAGRYLFSNGGGDDDLGGEINE